MKTILFGVLLLLTSASAARAQDSKPQGLTSQPNQTDSALTAETRKVFQSTSDNILKAARQMPEPAYKFKPADDTRTFGELMAHIATVQMTLCANMNGHPAKSTANDASKDDLVKALASSVTECDEAFSELSAENANKLVDAPAGKMTHLAALVYVITHASEEYGQMAIYLRLNHLAPPTNDQVKGTV